MDYFFAEFYDFRGAEDEAAASLLTATFTSLMKKAADKITGIPSNASYNSLIDAEGVAIPEQPRRGSILKNSSAVPTPNQLSSLQMTAASSTSLDSTSKSLSGASPSLTSLVALVSSGIKLSSSTTSISSMSSKRSSDGDLENADLNRLASEKSISGFKNSSQKKISPSSSTRTVVFPKDMVPRLVRDVVRMSEGEPHGIRGCTVVLKLEDFGGSDVKLGRVVCDPNIQSSCTLHLKLTRVCPPENDGILSLPFLRWVYCN